MQLRNDTCGLSGGLSPQRPAARLLAEHGRPAFSSRRAKAERCSRLVMETTWPASSVTSNGPRIPNRTATLRPVELGRNAPIVSTWLLSATEKRLELSKAYPCSATPAEFIGEPPSLAAGSRRDHGGITGLAL